MCFFFSKSVVIKVSQKVCTYSKELMREISPSLANFAQCHLHQNQPIWQRICNFDTTSSRRWQRSLRDWVPISWFVTVRDSEDDCITAAICLVLYFGFFNPKTKHTILAWSSLKWCSYNWPNSHPPAFHLTIQPGARIICSTNPFLFAWSSSSTHSILVARTSSERSFLAPTHLWSAPKSNEHDPANLPAFIGN